jgi:hypothetical protein
MASGQIWCLILIVSNQEYTCSFRTAANRSLFVIGGWDVSIFFFRLLACSKLSVLFALIQKEPKKSSPARSSAGRAGQPTWTFIKGCKYFLPSNWKVEKLASCLFITHGGAVFFVCIHYGGNFFYEDEKEGANTFFRDRCERCWFLVIKRLVPFLLKKYCKFSESKNGT